MPVLVHSFAVFDTCLAGAYARPSDLLYALARQVLPGKPALEDQHEFVRLRLAAQAEALRVSGLEAAGLGTVYQRFPRDTPWDLDPEALYATELELSLAGVRPVAPVLERVRNHLRRGERVVYVTDSMLPGPALRRLLESHGFAGEVYAAGDLGKRKSTGSLFRHLLAAEGLEARQLSHCGADPDGDQRAPHAVGIAVTPFPQGRLTDMEQHLLGMPRDCSPEFSRVVAVSRMARLRDDPPRQFAGLRRFGADVAAPVLCAFVSWALRGAGREGADSLYFLAREGQALHRVAGELAPRLDGGGPAPRYLMGSLAAWTAPLLGGIDRQDLDWLAAEGQSRRPADLLARLSLTPEELLSACGRGMSRLYSDQPFTDEELDELWDLLETPGARALLTGKAAQAGDMLLDYLERQGALARPVLHVADMGWTLYTQRALRLILARKGVEVRGWYFGLAGERLARVEAGAHSALFVERPGQAPPGSLEAALFRNVALLERAFTPAGHGRVIGYRRGADGVEPMLGPAPQDPASVQEIQDTAVAYARALAASGLGQEDLAALHDAARESLRRFLAEPDSDLARAVAELPGVAGEGGIVRRVTLRHLLRALLHSVGVGGRAASGPLWLEGSVAVSRAWLRPYLRRPRGMALLRGYFP